MRVSFSCFRKSSFVSFAAAGSGMVPVSSANMPWPSKNTSASQNLQSAWNLKPFLAIAIKDLWVTGGMDSPVSHSLTVSERTPVNHPSSGRPDPSFAPGNPQGKWTNPAPTRGQTQCLSELHLIQQKGKGTIHRVRLLQWFGCEVWHQPNLWSFRGRDKVPLIRFACSWCSICLTSWRRVHISCNSQQLAFVTKMFVGTLSSHGQTMSIFVNSPFSILSTGTYVTLSLTPKVAMWPCSNGLSWLGPWPRRSVRWAPAAPRETSWETRRIPRRPGARTWPPRPTRHADPGPSPSTCGRCSSCNTPKKPVLWCLMYFDVVFRVFFPKQVLTFQLR